MSGWGGGNWQRGRAGKMRPQGQGVGHSRGGSATGYSYFHNQNSSRNTHQNDWGYQGQDYQQQQWSTNADDEDYNFDLGFGQNNKISSLLDWGNSGGMRGFKSFSRPPSRPFPRGGRGRGGGGSGRGGGGSGRGGGGADKFNPRKRPRPPGPDARLRKRRQHEGYGGFGSPPLINDNYFGGNTGWAGDGFGMVGSFSQFDEWGQFPRGSQWDAPDIEYYNEEDAYSYQFAFGDYRGGYKGSSNYYGSKKSKKSAKKETKERQEKQKPVEDTPEDKLLHKKHRALTQLKEERKSLFQAVRAIMNATKIASETLSKEVQTALEAANTDCTMEVETPTDINKENNEDSNKENAEDSSKGNTEDGGKGDTEDSSQDNTEDSSKENTEDGSKENAEDGSKENTEDGSKENAEDGSKENTEDGSKDNTEDGSKDNTEDSSQDNTEDAKKDAASAGKKADVVLPPQVITGVIRVGRAQGKLLIKGAKEYGEELVVICKEKPTKEMPKRLANLIELNLKSPFSEKAVVSVKESEEKIFVDLSGFNCPFPIHISFTSPSYSKDRDAEEQTCDQNDDESDLLSKEKCLLGLRKIRRIRWARKEREDPELPVVRILIDFATRLSGWEHLEPYASEILVHTVTSKLSKDVRESELSISRIFIQCIEMLAQGLVLEGGPGLKDPCEAGSVDIFKKLNPQEAEDLTRAAQSALRAYACNQLQKLLDT